METLKVSGEDLVKYCIMIKVKIGYMWKINVDDKLAAQ